jgi:N utilization substance protein B
LALQSLYQWLLNASSTEELLTQAAEMENYAKADQGLLQTLVRGTVHEAQGLRERLRPHLDRRVEELSPVEHALLLMAAFELQRQLETPYKVVINEAVELAKSYGGTDGHKYVNGVLDKLAAEFRPDEVKARGRTI